MLMKRVNWIALATAIATAGCADSAMAPLTVARVSVMPSGHNLIPGAMVQLSAVAEAANGTAITGRETHWRSDKPFVASVDATGLVVAVSEGTALVSATIEGNTGAATIRVIGQLGPSRSGISRLIPESVAAGSGDFTLVVQGVGFSPAAQVSWHWLSTPNEFRERF
jgi:Big-like domain-containing protein